MNSLAGKALPDQVRHLNEERSAIATEPWNNLLSERMQLAVVYVVVVADIKRSARTRRPTSEKLRARPLTERVVIDNHTSKRSLRKLVCAANVQDINIERHASRVVANETLSLQIERDFQFVGRLIGLTYKLLRNR